MTVAEFIKNDDNIISTNMFKENLQQEAHGPCAHMNLSPNLYNIGRPCPKGHSYQVSSQMGQNFQSKC